MKKILFSVILICLFVYSIPPVSAKSETGGISVNDVTVTRDESGTAQIGIQCGDGIRYAEFDIVLSESIDMVSYKANESISEYCKMTEVESNKYNFAFSVPQGEKYKSSGYLIKIYLRGKENAKEGTYKLQIKNCKVYDINENVFMPKNVTAKVTLTKDKVSADEPVNNTVKCNHAFNGWTVTKQPTYEKEGKRVKRCTKCNKVCKILAIPKIEKRNIGSSTVKYDTKFSYTGKELKPSVKISYKGIALTAGTDYTVSYSNNKNVGTGKILITGKGIYKGSLTLKFSIVPRKVNGLKLKSRGDKSITLEWNKRKEGDKYFIYIYRNKEWEKIGETEKNYLKVSGLSSGSKYEFKVRAVKGKLKGEKSSSLTEYTRPDKVGIKNLRVTGNKIKISWNKGKNCDGYKIYVKYPGSSEFKLLKTVKDPTSTSYITGAMSKNGSYSFKIRTYINGGGEKINSYYCEIKSIKM